jgi:hypothetical protein
MEPRDRGEVVSRRAHTPSFLVFPALLLCLLNGLRRVGAVERELMIGRKLMRE